MVYPIGRFMVHEMNEMAQGWCTPSMDSSWIHGWRSFTNGVQLMACELRGRKHAKVMRENMYQEGEYD